MLDEQRAVWLGVIELVTCGVLGSQIQEEGLDLASGRLLAQCHSKST